MSCAFIDVAVRLFNDWSVLLEKPLLFDVRRTSCTEGDNILLETRLFVRVSLTESNSGRLQICYGAILWRPCFPVKERLLLMFEPLDEALSGQKVSSLRTVHFSAKAACVLGKRPSKVFNPFALPANHLLQYHSMSPCNE
jgi:hypothetical protein